MEITPTVEYLKNYFEQNSSCKPNSLVGIDISKKATPITSPDHIISNFGHYNNTLKCTGRQIFSKQTDNNESTISSESSPSSPVSEVCLKDTNAIYSSYNRRQFSTLSNRKELDDSRSLSSKIVPSSKLKVKPVVPKKPLVTKASKFLSPQNFDTEREKVSSNLDNTTGLSESSVITSSASPSDIEFNGTSFIDKIKFYSSLEFSVDPKGAKPPIRKNGLSVNGGFGGFTDLQNQELEERKTSQNSFSYTSFDNWNNDSSLSSSNDQENKKPINSACLPYYSYSSLENGMTISSDSSMPQSILKKHSSIGSRSQKSLSFKRELVSYAPESDCTSEASFLSFTNGLLEAMHAESTAGSMVLGNDTIRSSSTLRNNNTPLPQCNGIQVTPLEIGCSASNISGKYKRFLPDASYTNRS